MNFNAAKISTKERNKVWFFFLAFLGGISLSLIHIAIRNREAKKRGDQVDPRGAVSQGQPFLGDWGIR